MTYHWPQSHRRVQGQPERHSQWSTIFDWLTLVFLTFENVISCLSNFDTKHCVQCRNRDLMLWFSNINLTDNILASSLGQISVTGAEGQEWTVLLNRFQSEKTGSTGKPPFQMVPFVDLRHCNSTLSTLLIVWHEGDRTITNLCTYAKDDMRALFGIQWKGIQRDSFMWVPRLILEKKVVEKIWLYDFLCFSTLFFLLHDYCIWILLAFC